MKGVGHIYQQTFIDTYAKVALAKLYDCKTPITAADLVNSRRAGEHVGKCLNHTFGRPFELIRLGKSTKFMQSKSATWRISLSPPPARVFN
jgi:hypothetical protein